MSGPLPCFECKHPLGHGKCVNPHCPLAYTIDDDTHGRNIALSTYRRLRDEYSDMTARIATIADESFGPFPVQSPDKNLSEIERGIFNLRQVAVAEEWRAAKSQEEAAHRTAMHDAICGREEARNERDATDVLALDLANALDLAHAATHPLRIAEPVESCAVCALLERARRWAR